MDKLRRSLKLGAELIGTGWFLVMFGAFIIQVFTRYVLNDPLGWTTEMCLIAFLWFAFWSGGLITRESDQVRFDLLYQSVSPRVRRIFAIVTTGLIGGLFIAALPANVDFVTFMSHDVTWVMEIRFDYVFAVFIVFMVAFGVRTILRLIRLMRPGWRDRI
ncbi:MAG: TRAP transporter small permease subunit [Rhodospirillales bacterium]|nr:TRAP transporter small permease subunit [Rhodospirillales bacterium]